MRSLPCQMSLSMTRGQRILLMHYEKYQNRGRGLASPVKCLKVLCMKQRWLCLSFSFTYPGNTESGRADSRGWGREHVEGQGHWFLSLIKPCSCPLMPPTWGPDSACLKWFSSNCTLRCFCRWFWRTVQASLVAEMVKNLCAMQETRVQSLGWEDMLERGIPSPVFLPGEFHGQSTVMDCWATVHRVADSWTRPSG